MKRLIIQVITISLFMWLMTRPAYCQNIALVATASSSGGGTGVYAPSNMNDGLLEGSGNYHWVWHSAGNWVELTWPTAQDISQIVVDTTDLTAFTLCANEIQYWHIPSSSYITAGSKPSMINDWTYDFPAVVNTTKIRLFDVSTGLNPWVYEIEIYPPSPTPTVTPTSTSTPTRTPTPTGTWYSATPTPTRNCETEATLYEHYSVCENLQGASPGTKSKVWNFDDCDYCRKPPNPCFTVQCTFAMYVTAECGRDFHIPLYDNETGFIQIKSCETQKYMFLEAQSTGGWSTSGTSIQWEDCDGLDSRWNNQVTDIKFTDPVALCGVYRIEFVNWGGFIWDLYANCTGSDDPGFYIYDSYTEAEASTILRPELDISNLTVSGICPNFTVDADISNFGCDAVDATVCVETTIGGHWEFIVPAVGTGSTVHGSVPIVAPGCTTPFTITATVDCHDDIIECTEISGIGCNPAGTHIDSVEFYFGIPTPPPDIPYILEEPFLFLALLLGATLFIACRTIFWTGSIFRKLD
ncbi:MAG: hypothetical protein A2161_00030 [Candidatus Schekmanbacteria bacterium RBG_13_48_7]|uniref:Uncharacterized protein n=1 Tax=Candidatus Schekmanbacteria bacterium RBG_13_48_7 TaxID=1817878 RepID=A0A1F7RXL8_9BACT|nr:MAG: hypothetical protein A2161_00030 [Candidatus Schekmanbacteria bacterium RBG_13_48_7]